MPLSLCQNDYPPRRSRRAFLKTAVVVAGLMSVACASATIPVNRPPPPDSTPSLGGTLQILQWDHVVPSYNSWFVKFAQEWGAKTGVGINFHLADSGVLAPNQPPVDSQQRVAVDMIPHLTLPARFAAELAANHGHDLIQFATLDKTHLYAPYLVDLSEVCEKMGQKYGGWLPAGRALGVVNGIWRGYPDFYQAEPTMYRKDLFDQAGLAEPRTWDDLRLAGAELKRGGHPAGMAVSHCNDANHNWRTVMWAYGAHEVDADGKTVTINSPEMRDALRMMQALFDEAMTPDVFAWDDSSNNKYLVTGHAGWIHDAISAIRIAEIVSPDLAKTIAVVPDISGPSGRFSCVDANVYSIWKFAKNKPAALAFLEYYAENWESSFIASEGLNLPFLNGRYTQPMPVLGNDPQLQSLQEFYKFAQVYGYPGPPNAAAEEVLNAFILPDMVRRHLRGDSADEAIRWAEGELRGIYGRLS